MVFEVKRTDPFFLDTDIYIVLVHKDEFTDGSGHLTPEMNDWLTLNAIDALWTYRSEYGGTFYFVVKFTREEDLALFKLRWVG